MTVPTVGITVEDNGVNTSLLLPLNSVQFVFGCALAGTVNQCVATSNPATVQSTFVGGPLCEAAGLITSAGGTVVAMRIPIVTHGTAKTPQGTGTGTGLGSLSVTLDGTFGAYDDYYIVWRCKTGGTLAASGTSGITFQVSLDAGRNFSPEIALPANALTYTIPGTGVTLVLGTDAETYVAGDLIKVQTIGPMWNDAGVQAGLAAYGASQYALAGVGSMHLVGGSTTGGATAGDATAIQGYLDSLFNQAIYQRLMMSARDAIAPTAWGGAGETEATWIASLAAAFSAVSAKRVLVSAGHYNMPSAFANSTYGTVYSMRRPLSWAAAVRRVQVPPQRRAGRVKDGSLANISVLPTNDSGDGFIYHDERTTTGLDAARFETAMTWPKKQGFFVCQERLMSPSGSQFTELVLGNVIDVACSIGYQEGVNEVSDDLRLNGNGTLYANDANDIQSEINSGLADQMTNVGMISGALAAVSKTVNVATTGKIPIKISVLPRGYVNAIDETIGLQVPNTAPTGG